MAIGVAQQNLTGLGNQPDLSGQQLYDQKLNDYYKTINLDPTTAKSSDILAARSAFDAQNPAEGVWGTDFTGGEMLQGGLGVANLGLGVAGYLDQRKTAGLQRDVLSQQLESNRGLLDTRKKRASDISATFGSGLGA